MVEATRCGCVPPLTAPPRWRPQPLASACGLLPPMKRRPKVWRDAKSRRSAGLFQRSRSMEPGAGLVGCLVLVSCCHHPATGRRNPTCWVLSKQGKRAAAPVPCGMKTENSESEPDDVAVPTNGGRMPRTGSQRRVWRPLYITKSTQDWRARARAGGNVDASWGLAVTRKAGWGKTLDSAAAA